MGLNYSSPYGDGGGNEYYWSYRRTAYMINHIAEIIDATRGPAAPRRGPNGRWRPVLAGQVAGNP